MNKKTNYNKCSDSHNHGNIDRSTRHRNIFFK